MSSKITEFAFFARLQRAHLKLPLKLGLAGLLSVTFAGCLPLTAEMVPEDKGNVIPAVGTDRADVLAKFGKPDSSEIRDAKETDVYESVAGGPKPGNKLKILASAAALDAMTFGLADLAWVVVLPLSRLTDGAAIYDVYSVTYSPQNKVETVSVTTRKSLWVPNPQ
ncbi:MAG TPA: hypothetical protein VKB84_14030 [Candidatus Binataceae bacterium]|nr:hypothetical protein [Candidatus Binataceae bacterium]